MKNLSLSRLQAYRAQTYQTTAKLQVKDIEAGIEFVNRRGFAFFWPIKNIDFPSLWAAVAGDRPVPNNHDDPGHITWGWKDSLLDKRRWYYAKVLRKKATLISLEMFPYFYALSENYGSPAEDHLILYEQGRLSAESKAVYEAILEEGPLDTVALRRAAHLTSQESNSRFNRALSELQADFKIMPIGVAEAGAWRYAFIYEIVARYHPEVLDQARMIGEIDARTHLLQRYYHSMGAAPLKDAIRLFGWPAPQAKRAVQPLLEKGELVENVSVAHSELEHIALAELV
jgi:uncharacterized protein YcaQ